MALEPITRAEQIMSGKSLEPITREEMFLAKAAGMDVDTPEPITRREMFLSQISGGGSGGSGSESGNFKKKFVSLCRAYSGSAGYDYVTTLCSYMMNNGGVMRDEEVLPTKTYDGIKVSGETLHIYFIEDENDLFIYGDVLETGTPEWYALSILLGAESVGVITDIANLDVSQMDLGILYVFFYYGEAD